MSRLVAPGTSILLVLIVMSIITIAGLAVFGSGVFVSDFASVRVVTEQQFRLAHGLLEYGVAIAHSSYDSLSKNEENSEIIVELGNYKGKISFQTEKEGILIASWLLQKEKTICPLSCLLTKNDHQKMVIESFQRTDFSL